ncbi:MAG: hypothetical protein AMS27_08050 [Bacteroides sp. SM23_62_1]|nr:MAG: hypothetical protein AMS27_08050 [Bacteroides sp. SM23_62_1]
MNSQVRFITGHIQAPGVSNQIAWFLMSAAMKWNPVSNRTYSLIVRRYSNSLLLLTHIPKFRIRQQADC